MAQYANSSAGPPIDDLVDGTTTLLEAAHVISTEEDDETGKEDENVNGSAALRAADGQCSSDASPVEYHVDNSAFRVNRILSIIVPPVLGSFIIYGWSFASRFILPDVCRGSSNLVCQVYSYAFHFLLFNTTALFLWTYLTPYTHSSPASALPTAVEKRLIPHEVTSANGDYRRCWQDDCSGRVIPPKARHCKDCKRCRLDFDHHCPWVGCIAQDTLKPFILFLAFAPASIACGLWPVIPMAIRQTQLIARATWETHWMYMNWWNRKYSWIGGPIFRYLGATVLGFYRYEQPLKEDPLAAVDNGTVPISFTLVFYSIFGTILGALTLVLFCACIVNVARGTSTIETERRKKRAKIAVRGLHDRYYMSIPMSEGQKSNIREVPIEIRLYDFGLPANMRRVFGYTLREQLGRYGRPLV